MTADNEAAKARKRETDRLRAARLRAERGSVLSEEQKQKKAERQKAAYVPVPRKPAMSAEERRARDNARKRERNAAARVAKGLPPQRPVLLCCKEFRDSTGAKPGSPCPQHKAWREIHWHTKGRTTVAPMDLFLESLDQGDFAATGFHVTGSRKRSGIDIELSMHPEDCSDLEW